MIQLRTKDFVRAVAQASSVVERRNTIPIVGMLRLRQEGASLVMSGTDFDVQVDAKLPAEGENGSASIFATLPDAPALARALKRSGAEALALEHVADIGETRVAAGDLHVTFKGQPAEDWPDSHHRMSDAPGFSATLGPDAIDAIRRVSGAVSTEETRYYLNGVYLHKSAGPWAYTAVATDGHRLYMADFPLPDAQGELEAVIVPNKTVRLLGSLANGKPIRLTQGGVVPANAPSLDKGTGLRVRFDVGDAQITSKVIDGAYPDYMRVVPQDNPRHAVFKREELLRATETLQALGNEGGFRRRLASIAMKMVLRDGKALLSRRWADLDGSARTVAAYQGNREAEGVEFGVNARYLAELLGRLKGEEVAIHFGREAGHEPALLVSPTDDGFRAVLMGMRV